MRENINLYDLSVMEVLSLACALIGAIDRHDGFTARLGRGTGPISDARHSAEIVANLAAIEYVSPVGDGSEDAVLQAETLLRSLGVGPR